MNQPDYLNDYCTDEIEELFSKFQDNVLKSVAKRIIKYGTATPSSIDQIDILEKSGMVYDEIMSSIADLTSISQEMVNALFQETCLKCIEYDNEIYKKAGKSVPVKGSKAVQQIVKAAIKKTNNNLANLTMTTAEAGQQKFIDACSIAEMEISTGAFDVNTAIRHAVEYALQDGANVYFYDDDGKLTAKRNIVGAVRTAVMTGLSQTTGEISLQNAKEMSTDVMEISAHIGARPTHSVWQGKLVCISNRKTEYFTLADIGYDEVDGFKGINCRHYWFPFLEGISERTYTDKELEEMATKTVSYNGKEMLVSEANARQRAMERQIRYERSQLVALNESLKSAKANGNNELAEDLQINFDNLSVKLKSHEATYKDFCRQTGQPELTERLQYPGFNRSVSQKARYSAEHTIQIRTENLQYKEYLYNLKNNKVKLKEKHQKMLDMLPQNGSFVTLKSKDVKLDDLAALSAHEGCEFAIFGKGKKRIVLRGGPSSCNITTSLYDIVIGKKWKWIGHSHPTTRDLRASKEDIDALKHFTWQQNSVIIDLTGETITFTTNPQDWFNAILGVN